MRIQECLYCGKEKNELLMHTCSSCHGTYCINHRFPERHECISLNRLTERVIVGPATHRRDNRTRKAAYRRNGPEKEDMVEAKKAEAEEEDSGLWSWVLKMLHRKKE